MGNKRKYSSSSSDGSSSGMKYTVFLNLIVDLRKIMEKLSNRNFLNFKINNSRILCFENLFQKLN